jgi:putative membrane protein
MNTNTTISKRFLRALNAGVGIGAVMFATSTLQAQTAPPPPAGNSANNPPVTSEPVKGSDNLSHRSKEFLKDAGQMNQLEISLADVADTQSQNSQVRDLAKQMRDDHRKANDEVRALASAHGYTLDTTLDFMNEHTVNHFKDMDKSKFDREYSIEMLKGHVKTIKLFDKTAQKADEADVKQFAQSSLPTLRMHLKHSEDVARAVGVDESKIASIVKGVEVSSVDQNSDNRTIAQH